MAEDVSDVYFSRDGHDDADWLMSVIGGPGLASAIDPDPLPENLDRNVLVIVRRRRLGAVAPETDWTPEFAEPLTRELNDLEPETSGRSLGGRGVEWFEILLTSGAGATSSELVEIVAKRIAKFLRDRGDADDWRSDSGYL